MAGQEMALSIPVILRRNLYWLIGALFAILFVIFMEGSLIATTKLFGVARATLIRVSITIPLSWLVIYLATKSDRSFHFSNWLKEKEARLSKSAKVALQGGKFLAVLNTAIFLGPIIASILMLMIGIKARLVYIYAVISALLCAWLWSMFYCGMLWGIAKCMR